jgi:hypothetical protein
LSGALNCLACEPGRFAATSAATTCVDWSVCTNETIEAQSPSADADRVCELPAPGCSGSALAWPLPQLRALFGAWEQGWVFVGFFFVCLVCFG